MMKGYIKNLGKAVNNLIKKFPKPEVEGIILTKKQYKLIKKVAKSGLLSQ